MNLSYQNKTQKKNPCGLKGNLLIFCSSICIFYVFIFFYLFFIDHGNVLHFFEVYLLLVIEILSASPQSHSFHPTTSNDVLQHLYEIYQNNTKNFLCHC